MAVTQSDRPNSCDSSSLKGYFTEARRETLKKSIDLDDVLVNELGQFGRFQLYNLVLIAFPIIVSAFVSEYIFSAAAISHRCLIPECGETLENAVYNNTDMTAAFPAGASCERYVPLSNSSLDHCPRSMFDLENTVPCDEFVYERDNSVVYEFDLGCKDWLRALAGTLNSVGTLLVLPIIGFISDRWGRRVALIISIFNHGFIALIRAFSVNYPMYLALQLLQTTLGAGTFSSAYVLATELVGPKYRVLTSGAFCSAMFSSGQIILGVVAWAVQPWRYMLIALHVPCFLIISYYWLLTESVRWLLSKKKFTEAIKILKKIAKVNGTKISEKSIDALVNPSLPEAQNNQIIGPGLVDTIMKSRVLLQRMCTTPIWWVSTMFVYYGLSINSTTLASTNMYLNYILISAIEIPGFFTAILVLDRVGRKTTLVSGYFLSAACNIAFVFISEGQTILKLIIYLLGKFGISVVMTSMYLFTSELYPTQFRHTLLAFSSMIGRIGSITAPLTPVLANFWHGIPSLLFGGMGLVSGVLVLTQPETLGTKMPDTLAEAEALGTPASKAHRPA